MYTITTDPVELLSGTTNRTSPVYMEALDTVNAKSSTVLGKIKKLIEAIKKKYKNQDKSISGSKGNIESYKDNTNIEKAFDILNKHATHTTSITNLQKIYTALKKNHTLYEEGYSKYIDLITIEYEMAVTTLVTGLEYQLISSIEIEEKNGSLFIRKSSGKENAVLDKLISGFAEELNNTAHVEYLRKILKTKDEYKVSTDIHESMSFQEAGIIDIAELIRQTIYAGYQTAKTVSGIGARIVKSIFNITTLLRAATYYFYQRKANKIISLSEQIRFIELNIEQLQNMKTMPEEKKAEIIKKQRAIIEAYKKKCEKLYAQLSDGSREASQELKQDEPEIKKNDADDDFQL